MLKKRWIISLVLILVIVLTGCTQGGKQPSSGEQPQDKYPEKEITWVVGYPPASPADTTSRLLAKYAEKYLPNNGKFVIVNKPGSGGTIGLTDVFNAKADGYTIGTTAMAAMVIQPLLGKTTYGHDSFDAIINYVDAQQLFFVQWDSPIQNVEDLIAYTKDNPGVKYAVSGVMSGNQVGMETFAQKVGIKMDAVAYDDEPGSLNALLRGDVTLAGLNGAISYQYYETKQIRPVFNYSGVNIPFTADEVPSLIDAGYDVEVPFFNGILAPKGVPANRLAILTEAFQKALQDPEMIEEFETRQLVSNPKVLDEFQELMNKLAETNKEVLKNMGAIE